MSNFSLNVLLKIDIKKEIKDTEGQNNKKPDKGEAFAQRPPTSFVFRRQGRFFLGTCFEELFVQNMAFLFIRCFHAMLIGRLRGQLKRNSGLF